jgi:CheY-like chemotaxis protein
MTENISVLLIDDDVELLVVLAKQAPQGWTVKGANSLKEAVEVLKKESFDCVACDLNMPGGSGRLFAKVLKSYGLPIPPTFLMTGDLRGMNVAQNEDGFMGLLEKPFSTKEFFHVVREVIAIKKLPKTA